LVKEWSAPIGLDKKIRRDVAAVVSFFVNRVDMWIVSIAGGNGTPGTVR